jgi:hypothetical protein
MLQKQRRKSHGLTAEILADGRFRGCSVIPLVEKQIKRSVNSRKASGEAGKRVKIKQLLRLREHLLGSGNSFLDGGVATDERGCHLVDAEPAQNVKYQGNSSFFGEPRMAAREHHPQQVVFDCVLGKQIILTGASVHSL